MMSCCTSRRALQSFAHLRMAPKFRDVLRFCGVRFFCDNPTARLSLNTALPSFGVLLDIDGVLIRGRNPIPGAREALEMLRQSEIPTVFLTNGGCESEKEAAERLSDKIGFEVGLSHTIILHSCGRCSCKPFDICDEFLQIKRMP